MKHEPDEYDDPEILEEWLEEQREHVLEYLAGEGVAFQDIEDCLPAEPDFCVAPYIAVWPVLQPLNPNYIAYWVISGDLPTDYVSGDDASDAREVLAHFSESWKEVAACMRAGEKHPTITMGPPEMWPKMAPLLEARSEILKKYVEDEDLWEEYEEDDDDPA